jgi:hypothetical protein
MMLDPDVARAVLEGRSVGYDDSVPDSDPRKPSIAKYREGKRIKDYLVANGHNLDQVCFLFCTQVRNSPVAFSFTQMQLLLSPYPSICLLAYIPDQREYASIYA